MQQDPLDWLRKEFPKRWALRADEVAMVLGRSKSGDNAVTRGVSQRVRERIKSGRYGTPVKIDGSWQLPLTDLANVLKPSPTATQVLPSDVSTSSSPKIGRRKSEIGPRLRLIRESQFWDRVFSALGMFNDAREIALLVERARRDGRDARVGERANESRASLTQSIEHALALKPEGDGSVM